ncbi:3-hydroxyacyl-CoA dehydrogenase/enoyl-CoA hydratase/3-hydroxybutyryl-CoA epimerase [Haloferula luteola]|uniref:enoyl-CoA hydratase n=1 Tax=Haloferula luteola TaxID=595692 RepID=A0A840V5Y2_9BACT|nr:3-hydroxyacyl-CoA dehydrogenase NAD-binding domain-containing protein [Haloferula luteola]MBB5351034.1 3-hydroxyacyl-CoA dehydrogenase/enoyl-CoA hydratase/3-hydroxybutyryl-CoA epimerase [Haloferula luteola]
MNLSLTHLHGLATLTLDRQGSSANLLDRATLEELRATLDTLSKDHSVTGLLVRSAKPTIFIAGANLDKLTNASGSELAELIDLGHQVFNQLAELAIPTVAAIHGACVGGGLELALACDWRVASDSAKTRIGLPETQLGILPAWGGSTRLPRLVGLPTALPLVLSGKLLKATSAQRKGLVDAVAPLQRLEPHAITFLQKGKRPPHHHAALHHPLSVAIIRRKAHADLLEKTRGHYPAPLSALEVMCRAVSGPIAASFAREKAALLRLAALPETTSLMRLFHLTERARKHSLAHAEPHPIDRVAVIGAGVMGSGIAYWLSTRGIEVILQDVSDSALAQGYQRLTKNYETSRRKHILTTTEAARGLDRIHLSSGKIPLDRCQLIIEAATENLDIKKTLFADLASRSHLHTLLATNTSALPLRDLAPSVTQPSRLVGLHFFNPVHRMQLVEVVRTPDTSDETLATAVSFVRRIGKLPVVVRDSPGFLVNRILLPYLVAAAEVFEKGGNPKVIDDAMLQYGMPMGPLRLLDEVGLDVALHVARTLAAAFPDRMQIPAVVEKLVASGHLGRKSGEGFYRYGKGHPEPSETALRLRTGTEAAPLALATRFAFLMADEAKRCLREGVAESADDIDLAMVLGTGFPPFRGGPLYATSGTPTPPFHHEHSH